MINNQGVSPDHELSPAEAERNANPEIASALGVVNRRVGSLDTALENIYRAVGYVPEQHTATQEEAAQPTQDIPVAEGELRAEDDRKELIAMGEGAREYISGLPDTKPGLDSGNDIPKAA